MTGARIRPAGVEMAAVLSELHIACFTPLPETPWSESAMRTILRMPGARGYVAFDAEETPCGLLIGRETGEACEILTVCVAPLARRRGLARSLFAALRRDSGVYPQLVLEVAVDNASAISLYNSLGFQEVGRRPAYYNGGGKRVDALVLATSPSND
jgi:ribosomal-protein-alanine N-acetyltransferase